MGIRFGGGPAAQGLGEGASAAAQGSPSNNSRNLRYPDAGHGARAQAGSWDMSKGLRFA